ncbi:MAG: 3'-5' exonuclease [Peptostreptococcaceae bacterium]
MIRIYVDFEMNIENIKDKKSIRKSDIISIGAVKYDTRTGNTSEFKSLIKPIINVNIFEHIKELTNITQEELDNSPSYYEVIRKFKLWLGDFSQIEGIYTFGSLDFTCLDAMDKYSAKKYNHPRYIHNIKNLFIDIKEKYMDMGINSINYISLKNLIEYVNKDFYGTAHDSLYDAYNLLIFDMATEHDKEIKDILILRDFIKKPFINLNPMLKDNFEMHVENVHKEKKSYNSKEMYIDIIKTISDYLISLIDLDINNYEAVRDVKRNFDTIIRLENISCGYFNILDELYVDMKLLIEDIILSKITEENYEIELNKAIDYFEKDLENANIILDNLKRSC